MIPDLLMPKGFRAAGINCGVRRYRPDLGFVVSDLDCVAAAVFTRSSLKAAPVLYGMKILPSAKIRALIVNSGHANAATGEEGYADNQKFVEKAAAVLGINPDQVLSSSTGVIGVRPPLDLLLSGVEEAAKNLSDTINRFALSIMTTDLVPKFFSKTLVLSGGEICITGAAKGSGMIHPNMGTMLGYVFTDAKIDKVTLGDLVRDIADSTFNMISVDGETSTNDTFAIFANGASGVSAKNIQESALLREALLEVAQKLAISIAKDGEGASKLITIRVEQASTQEEARTAARSITTSPLIKSAIHGEDPNWGRILARLGQAGVSELAFRNLELKLQGVTVFSKGSPIAFDRGKTRELLKTNSVVIEVQLHSGNFSATAWGCDLTKRYVEINTEYS